MMVMHIMHEAYGMVSSSLEAYVVSGKENPVRFNVAVSSTQKEEDHGF